MLSAERGQECNKNATESRPLHNKPFLEWVERDNTQTENQWLLLSILLTSRQDQSAYATPWASDNTKSATPFWAGRVSLALRLLSDPRRGTPLQQERFQQAFVTSPGTLLAQQPRVLLPMTASPPQGASSVSAPLRSSPLLTLVLAEHHGGVWITNLSQLLITVNELGRKEVATNLFAERSTLFMVRDSSQGSDWQYNSRI